MRTSVVSLTLQMWFNLSMQYYKATFCVIILNGRKINAWNVVSLTEVICNSFSLSLSATRVLLLFLVLSLGLFILGTFDPPFLHSWYFSIVPISGHKVLLHVIELSRDLSLLYYNYKYHKLTSLYKPVFRQYQFLPKKKKHDLYGRRLTKVNI